MTSRRTVLRAGLSAAAGAAALGTLSACGPGASRTEDSGLTITWWGNALRDELTQSAIDTFSEAHPDPALSPQAGEWTSYWDRLATQVAGGTPPDLIQMDEAYLSEYAARGTLLDLAEKVDTSAFRSGTEDAGVVEGITAGISIGVNALAFIANPAVFEAAGVDLPDDTTWTWDDFRDLSAEITAASPEGTVGATGMFTNPKLLQVWLRQRGTELFTAEGGAGYSEADIDEYLQFMMSFREAGAIAEASVLVEDSGASLDQSMLATGTAGIGFYGSNQLSALTDATGNDLVLLRWPSMTGSATDRMAWYKSASLWSVSADTARPDDAAAFIDWWVNDPACAPIVLNERGMPANTERAAEILPELDAAGIAVADFLDAIEGEIGPTPPLPPPGGSVADTSLTRVATEVLFEETTTAQAAETFVADVDAAIA